MNWITKIGIRIGLVQLDSLKVKSWIKDKNLDMLAFALKKGLYRERIQAIKGFALLNEKSVIPALLEIGREDFEVVAKEAILAIETLDTNLKYTSEIEKLKAYWASKNQVVQPHSTKRTVTWVDKKSRMGNLERLREQLKKPIRF